jgi:hypothetical protein
MRQLSSSPQVTVLERGVIENIRSIFIHNGEPVAVDEAAKLLGWHLATMDAAIKWRVVTLDDTSKGEPRISRAELVAQAIEQWPLADIRAALAAPRVKHAAPPPLAAVAQQA